MTDTNRYSNVITVDGYNREGNLDTIRIAKPGMSRLVALRRLREGASQAITDTFNQPIPYGMTANQWRSSQMRNLYNNSLPPVGPCDYDIGGCGCNNGNGGGVATNAWLVGGNNDTQLPPNTDIYNLGVLESDPTNPVSNSAVDILTAGVTRIRIMGNDPEDVDYSQYTTGRSYITNGFIEQEEVPAVLNIVPTIDGLGSVSDIYLERPSNAYTINLTALDTTALFIVYATYPFSLLEAGLVAYGGASVDDPFTNEAWLAWLAAAAVPGAAQTALNTLNSTIIANIASISTALQAQAYTSAVLPYFRIGIAPNIAANTVVLYVANIFLGDKPDVTPVNTSVYFPNNANVQPNPDGIGSELYETLDITSFNYLLKILNSTSSDVALVFNLPAGSTIGGRPVTDYGAADVRIFSNANSTGVGSFIIPAFGGAGFFQMRVNQSIGSPLSIHTMLSNVEYESYLY